MTPSSWAPEASSRAGVGPQAPAFPAALKLAFGVSAGRAGPGMWFGAAVAQTSASPQPPSLSTCLVFVPSSSVLM